MVGGSALSRYSLNGTIWISDNCSSVDPNLNFNWISNFAVNAVLAHERHLALTFMLIVVAFFVCYLPAIVLNIHEAVTINQGPILIKLFGNIWDTKIVDTKINRL